MAGEREAFIVPRRPAFPAVCRQHCPKPDPTDVPFLRTLFIRWAADREFLAIHELARNRTARTCLIIFAAR